MVIIDKNSKLLILFWDRVSNKEPCRITTGVSPTILPPDDETWATDGLPGNWYGHAINRTRPFDFFFPHARPCLACVLPTHRRPCRPPPPQPQPPSFSPPSSFLFPRLRLASLRFASESSLLLRWPPRGLLVSAWSNCLPRRRARVGGDWRVLSARGCPLRFGFDLVWLNRSRVGEGRGAEGGIGSEEGAMRRRGGAGGSDPRAWLRRGAGGDLFVDRASDRRELDRGRGGIGGETGWWAATSSTAGGTRGRPRSTSAEPPCSWWVQFLVPFGLVLPVGACLILLGMLWISQLDFDGGSPPEQAWRRRLNSHANLLKEFSVTFMEAMRMVCYNAWFSACCSSSLISVTPASFPF